MFQLMVVQSGIATVTVNHAVNDHWLSPKLLSVNLTKTDVNPDWLWATSTTIRTQLAELCGAGFVRYPSGEQADRNHWLEQVGYNAQDNWLWKTSDQLPVVEDAHWMNLVEYKAMVAATGMRHLIGINIDTRLSDASSTMMTNLKNDAIVPRTKVGAGKTYFIGNESYFDWTVGSYSWMFQQIADALKADDSSCEVVANWKPQFNADCGNLLNWSGSKMDWLDVHEYWNWGAVSWDNWKSDVPLTYGGQSLKARIGRFKTEIANRGLSTKIIIGEWNAGQAAEGATTFPSRYQHGLMTAEMFMEIIKSGADAAAFWPCIWKSTSKTDGGDKRCLFDATDGFKPTPAYHFLKQFTPAMKGTMVSATSDADATVVTAVKQDDGDTLYVYILNKRKDQHYVPLKFTSAFGETSATMQTVQAKNGAITGAEIAWSSESLTKVNGEYGLTLPEWSLNRITLKK